MGIYSSYLDQSLSTAQLAAERKKQLAKIAEIRKRSIFVFAADLSPMKAQKGAPVALDNSDLMPITDQFEHLEGDHVDVILETPGGSGTVAEDIVRMLRHRFKSLAFIVPGQAKSAGTIMAMAGDEILMDYRSAVGPIDAQITFEGKVFSAEALLKGINEIVDQTERAGSLNRAYIPILQRLSPGDIQNAQNALDFARFLVRDWLCEYKFKNWTHHRTHNAGAAVTDGEKRERAQEIADALCDHSRWLSHGRSIRMTDLKQLGLEIIDYSEQPDLADAIRRYYVLLRIMFDTSAVYKIIETPTSQINRVFSVPSSPGLLQQIQAGIPESDGLPNVPVNSAGLMVDFRCPKCASQTRIQLDFAPGRPLQPGATKLSSDGVFKCPNCQSKIPLNTMVRQIEQQAKRKVVL